MNDETRPPPPCHLTVDDIRRRVSDIDAIADSMRDAHKEEDRLLREVLNTIAAGASNAAELAQAALETFTLDFDRQYGPGES